MMNDKIRVNGRMYQKVNEKYQSEIKTNTTIDGYDHPILDIPKIYDADDASAMSFQALYTLMAVYDWIEDNWDDGWLEDDPQHAKKLMSDLDRTIKQTKKWVIELRDNYQVISNDSTSI